MYHKIEDFQQNWSQESKSTLKSLRQLTDSSLDQRVTTEGRSLGDIAWHITLTLGEMLGRTGLSIEAPPEDAPMPSSAAEIANIYENAARSVGEKVLQNWSDDSLTEEVDMYGDQWKKGVVLSVLILHEVHHRGQMTVLMRQAGLKVPGVYGPSREEWAQMGLPPMK